MPREDQPARWTRSVFGRTLHEHRRALLGWCAGIAATVLLELALFPTVRSNDMSELLDSYPESVKQMFGLTDFATGTGYVRAELFSFVLPLMLIIVGVLWGSDAIAGEEDRKTIDLLLANPISRRRIVTEKCSALVVELLVIGCALLGALIAGDAVFSVGVSVARLVDATIMSVLLATVFAVLSLALGAATGRRGLARGVPAALAVGAYMLSALAPLADWLEPWRPASPWYHALGVDPLATGLPAWHVLALVALVAAGGALAVVTFDRRDIAV